VTIVDALGALRRQWYVVAVGLVLTTVLAMAAAYTRDGGRLVSRFAAQYETTAMVDVGPPAGADAATNSGALRVAYSLDAIVESPSFVRQVASATPGWRGGTVKASVPTQTTLVQLLVSGPSSASASSAMEQILQELPAVAATIESPQVEGPARFPLTVTGAPTPPAERPAAKGQVALALVVLVGLAITWSLVVSLDRARRGTVADRPVADLRDPPDRAVRTERERARVGGAPA
jgi:hypothetical protein